MLHSSGVVRSSLGSSVLMTPATCKSATLPAQFCPAHQVFVLGPTCQTCIFFGCRVHTLIRACVETGFLYLKKPAFSWFLRVAGNTLYKTTTKKSVCPFIISISIYHPVIETPTSQLLFILYTGPGTKLSFFIFFAVVHCFSMYDYNHCVSRLSCNSKVSFKHSTSPANFICSNHNDKFIRV
jgi:hypothetical protein